MKNGGKWVYNKNGKIIKMRSCYELMFADILDNRCVLWEYEPKLFKLKDGMRYRPDFLVANKWFEVKGYFSQIAKDKTNEFISQGNNLSIITLKDIESEHPVAYKKYKKNYLKMFLV